MHRHDDREVDFATYVFDGFRDRPVWEAFHQALETARKKEGRILSKNRPGETWGQYLPRFVRELNRLMRKHNLWNHLPEKYHKKLEVHFGGYTQVDDWKHHDGETAAILNVKSGRYEIFWPFKKKGL